MKFSKLFEIEKKYLGGGYYHPRMYGTIIKDVRYKNSGETMLDIDRVAGGSINTTPAGIKFWALIDNAVPSKETWKWNSYPDDLMPQLSQLAAQMMFPEYKKLCNSYLSKGLIDIVNKDAALTFNFLYATFNGAGFFKYFAAAFKIYVENQKITDPKILMDKMIHERETLDPKIFGNNALSLLKQGAKTIHQILPLIQGTVEFDIDI
jgi:hypothetical protein